MKLIFVRHGQTDWNLSKQFCGFSDVQMNKFGVMQAQKTAERLREEDIDYIYSSDLRRTVETAEIIRDLLCSYNSRYYPDGPLEIIKREDLREMNFGNWEGITYNQMMKQDPKLGAEWSADSLRVRCPKGESLVDLYERANAAIDDIKANTEDDKTVLIVAHSGVIRTFLSKDLVGDYNAYWHFEVINGGIVKVEHTAGFSVLEAFNV